MKTTQEKKEYFMLLRKRWQEAKKLAEQNEVKAAYNEAMLNGVRCSATGWIFTKMQMDKLGLQGTPYIDAKTFKGWKDSGYCVKKGEKSIIDGLTWIVGGVEKEDDDSKNDITTMYPKRYCLFHSSQVQPL